mmetsp:Transcript_11328/g.19822  ORF Transcript_11328/g.19822 Transcript_11328/m.19822 type:complete len:243 (-) Transcript_11328:214-942(-)
MSFIGGLFGGGPRQPNNPADSQSLLSDWQSYTNKAQDVETGSEGLFGASLNTAGTNLSQSATQASSSVTSFLQKSLTTVKSGVNTGIAGLPTSESLSIPSGQQLVYFFAFLAGGGVFLLLAFVIFLPVIILSPSKFALSFTLGCLLIMVGFAQLRGWQQQLGHMFSKERLPFSAAYLGSIAATLYCALVMKSYLLSLLCSGLQVVTLLYYLMSYFPGGTEGLKFMLQMFANAMMSCFGKVLR